MALTVLTAWWGLVLLYSPLLAESLRPAVTGLWFLSCLGALAAFTRRRWRGRAAVALLAGMGIVAAGWSALEPSNDRDWQRDVFRERHGRELVVFV